LSAYEGFEAFIGAFYHPRHFFAAGCRSPTLSKLSLLPASASLHEEGTPVSYSCRKNLREPSRRTAVFFDLQIAAVAVSIHRSAKGAAQFLNDLA